MSIRSATGRSVTDIRVRRVVVVVVDGLRADCADVQSLPHFDALRRVGAWTHEAQTVQPSVTVAAMASLLTGVSPRVHGFRSDRFAPPSQGGHIHPLPQVLGQHGIASRGHLRRLPWAFRGIARRLARYAGFSAVRFRGETASDVLAGATAALDTREAGLVLMHWPDADDAGHTHGWMSTPYRIAVLRLDAALGELHARLDLADTSDTLLIVLADHGGGGIVATSHDAGHRLNSTIPLVLAGAGIAACQLPARCSLLDVPATVLDAFGIALPASYEGMSLLPFARGRASLFEARLASLSA